MKIFKYELVPGIVGVDTYVDMPSGAKVLSVQEQNNGIMVWAAVNPSNAKTTKKFLVIPTGLGFDVSVLHQYNFVGTVQLDSGMLIFHVFEAKS